MIVRTDRTVLTYNNLHYILCLELASLDFIIYPTKTIPEIYVQVKNIVVQKAK